MSEARQFAELLFELKACSEARAWANGKSIEQAWSECTNPSWMMWLLGRSQVSKKIIVACAIEFAEMCVHNAKDYPEVAKCIEVVKRFKAGQAEEEELSAAGSAAWSAAESAARSAAGSAARSAAWSAWSAAGSAESAAGSAESAAGSAESAARSAESAARSAESAARSARSAARSAESAAGSAESAAGSARSAARSAACDAVRKHVPASEIAKLFALSEANQ